MRAEQAAFPVWDRTAARDLARLAHHGQRDKTGAPYIRHPEAVAALTARTALRRGWSAEDVDLAIQVAWLHDVIEDTRLHAGLLQSIGVPMDVLGPVMSLTRPSGGTERTTERYYRRIAEEPIALLVKECDIEHNLAPERLALLDEETQARLRRKYAKAREALGLTTQEA